MALSVLTITVVSHGLIIGDQIFIEGVNGFNGALNKNTYTVLYVVDVNNFKIAADVSYTYQLGGRIHKFVSSVSGPSHLNGQTVDVVTNGDTVTSLVYSNGVTLPIPAWNISIGLPYQWLLRFLPLGGDGQTVNQGKERKVFDVVLRIFKSLGGQFGKDLNKLYDIDYTATGNINRNADDDVLFTGDLHDVGFESSMLDYWEPVLTDTTPFPFQLLAAIIRSEICEDK